MNYAEFFKRATGRTPFDYQTRLAARDRLPDLIDAPTGAGKTAAILLAWLWRRNYSTAGEPMPRRLAYCLPMRVLVEQTRKAIDDWIGSLGDQGIRVCEGGVHVLMGGEEPTEWDIYPEREAILIGTQDMLLSRALNRGYGMSRFRWPMPYGLLNNDCLWVFDEVQLMGAGVATSAQLAGLHAGLGTFGSCRSVWMSATMAPEWLSTVDHRKQLDLFELPDSELTTGPIGDRMHAKARKTLHRAELNAGPADKQYGKALAEAIKANARPGTLTLAVLNTVDRAASVYEEVRKIKGPEVILLHSRFRPRERELLRERVGAPIPESGRIIVSTQVIEAGVDLSASVVFTELAPWSSLVQRLGRCHRHGEDGDEYRAFWIDVPPDKAAPYEAQNLAFARPHLAALEGRDVSPFALRTYQKDAGIRLRFEHEHVIRRRDVIDLFDTSPDLSGNDIDVSRFVRGSDRDTDVQLFWREFSPKVGPGDQPGPARDELCPAPIRQAGDFLEKAADRGVSGYLWDHLDRRWRPIRTADVRPGMTLLLPTKAGGYAWSDEGPGTRAGWDPRSSDPVEPLPHGTGSPEDVESDPLSARDGPAVLLHEHTEHVSAELRSILGGLASEIAVHREVLERASLWHDVGKAHPAFREAIQKADGSLAQDVFWAKSGKRGRLRYSVGGRHRRYFRHELASALAALQSGLPFDVAYLIAAHHGKVRLSIRSLPDEVPEDGAGSRFALGISQGDPLPEVRLGDSTIVPAMTLDLSPMELGGDASWSARAIALRDTLGPFRLAYLEALLRAADMRASRSEVGDA